MSINDPGDLSQESNSPPVHVLNDDSGVAGPVKGHKGVPYVRNTSQYVGSVTTFENTDVVDSREDPTTDGGAQPAAGARVVTLAFIDKGSAVATELYVVFNATSDADATTKLGSAATRHVIMLNERRSWTVAEGNEITRIDFMSDDAAPVGGSNKVAGEYVI